VRGHLHWVGVMWDWGWEGELLRSIVFQELFVETNGFSVLLG
jgi:hypothetical protein